MLWKRFSIRIKYWNEEFKIVNYFDSCFLLMMLSEPTDFRALGNFLAGRKKNLSIFNNSFENFSCPVKITWKEIHCPVLELWVSLKDILSLCAKEIQKLLYKHKIRRKRKKVWWNAPRLTVKLQGWQATHLPSHSSGLCVKWLLLMR